uniref:Uncharacterized protein n=1 Tax=Octopus bimaculoides TaxID=37653 RepID=A0A0L8HA87_OCTBM
MSLGRKKKGMLPKSSFPLYPTNKQPLFGLGRGFIRSTNIRTICNKIHSGRFKELAPGIFGIKKAAAAATLCLLHFDHVPPLGRLASRCYCQSVNCYYDVR